MAPTPAPGVEPDYDTYAESETDTTRHKPDPVDVRVIAAAPTPDARPRSIVTEQVPIGNGLVTRIAGENRQRVRLTVQGAFWIGGPGVTTGTGFNMATWGAPLVIESTAAVYGIADSDGAICEVFAEFLDG